MAGMSEIATNVLHNVGNVLNSVNISANLLTESVKRSKLDNLAKVAASLNLFPNYWLQFYLTHS